MSMQGPGRTATNGARSHRTDMPVQPDASWHRRPVAPAPTPCRSYPATTEAVADARRHVVRLARGAGASEPALADIALAVSEASTNAILHAYSSPGTRGEMFAVSTALDGGLFSVWVSDEGQGGTPDLPSPGIGWGLELMRRLCERVLIGVLKDGRTQVEMRFDLRAAASS